jgi:hypothetical protein
MTLQIRLPVAVTALLVALALVFASAASAADKAAPDDVARILAGLKPAASSPLAPLTEDGAFASHARRLDASWKSLDQRQLSKIRDWSKTNVAKRQDTVYYFFSGPDFLYADAFLPDAKTYVLAGLEPAGALPDLAAMSRRSMSGVYEEVHATIGTVMNYSFFITKDMKEKMRSGALRGNAPIIAVFLARAGKTITDVSHVSINAEGKEQPLDKPDSAGPANGVKFTFTSPGGKTHTLYYFSTNLANDGAKSTGFLKFCQALGPADSFVKSASYLMHNDSFSTVRNFLLEHSATISQDDSGVPVRFFDDAKWTLKPFGNYVGPISLFSGSYQGKLKDLFVKAKAPRVDFGIGYRWRPSETNLLLAIKK